MPARLCPLLVRRSMLPGPSRIAGPSRASAPFGTFCSLISEFSRTDGNFSEEFFATAESVAERSAKMADEAQRLPELPGCQ